MFPGIGYLQCYISTDISQDAIDKNINDITGIGIFSQSKILIR